MNSTVAGISTQVSCVVEKASAAMLIRFGGKTMLEIAVLKNAPCRKWVIPLPSVTLDKLVESAKR